MNITEKQAQKLEVKAKSRWSPYLEKCCLLLSANESYQRAEEDIKVLTGIEVSHGTQQRMVHRQTFELPLAEQSIEEISIDGGQRFEPHVVRLRTTRGKPCEWRDYKAVNLHSSAIGAFFQDNSRLVDWVNQQPLSNPLTCSGDGHPGIWNIFAQIGNQIQRRERRIVRRI